MVKSQVKELAHGVRFSGGDNEILGPILLQHQPHRLNIVRRMAPIALRVQIAKKELVL